MFWFARFFVFGGGVGALSDFWGLGEMGILLSGHNGRLVGIWALLRVGWARGNVMHTCAWIWETW